MKKSLQYAFLMTFMPALGLSCGRGAWETHASLPQSAGAASDAMDDKDPDAAVLYFGGYSSCATAKNMSYPNNAEPIGPASDPFNISMSRWLNGFEKVSSKPHRTLISCYPFWTNVRRDGGSSGGGSPGTHSPLPPHVSPMESFIYLRHDLNGAMIPSVHMKLGHFLAQLETQLASQHIRKVAIMGHSYGGYTSMLVAKALSAPGSRIKVTSLTTLDPISMDTCQPQMLVNHLVREAPAPGCKTAPAMGLKDAYISVDDVQKIAGSVPWTNLWQGVDTSLHASPLPMDGIDNQEVIYDQNNKNGFANHLLFVFPADKTNPIWPQIADSILKRMAKSLD